MKQLWKFYKKNISEAECNIKFQNYIKNILFNNISSIYRFDRKENI